MLLRGQVSTSNTKTDANQLKILSNLKYHARYVLYSITFIFMRLPPTQPPANATDCYSITSLSRTLGRRLSRGLVCISGRRQYSRTRAGRSKQSLVKSLNSSCNSRSRRYVAAFCPFLRYLRVFFPSGRAAFFRPTTFFVIATVSHFDTIAIRTGRRRKVAIFSLTSQSSTGGVVEIRFCCIRIFGEPRHTFLRWTHYGRLIQSC